MKYTWSIIVVAYFNLLSVDFPFVNATCIQFQATLINVDVLNLSFHVLHSFHHVLAADL